MAGKKFPKELKVWRGRAGDDDYFVADTIDDADDGEPIATYALQTVKTKRVFHREE